MLKLYRARPAMHTKHHNLTLMPSSSHALQCVKCSIIDLCHFNSLHMSQVAYQVGAYRWFLTLEATRDISAPPGWDASLWQVYIVPSIKFAGTHLYTLVESQALWESSVLSKNTTQSPGPGLQNKPGPLDMKSCALTLEAAMPTQNPALILQFFVCWAACRSK